MSSEFSHLYWHYYPNTISKGYMYSWFDLDTEFNTIYLYSLPEIDITQHIPTPLQDYVYSISSSVESLLLDQMGNKGIIKYTQLLKDLGFGSEYKLYKIFTTDTFLDEFQTYCTNN